MTGLLARLVSPGQFGDFVNKIYTANTQPPNNSVDHQIFGCCINVHSKGVLKHYHTSNNIMSAKMDSESSNSNSLFDISFGTESQPLMFRYIEGQKWRKLRKMLKRSNGKDMCRERDDSGLTLVGMALGFEAPLDIIKSIFQLDPSQISATDFFGATPLHVACLNAASLDAIEYLLVASNNSLAKIRDKDHRIPLHHAVECLCRNEIGFTEGTEVIEMLIEADPDAIHAADKHDDSPLDLVQLARMEVYSVSKELSRLSRLYEYLRQVSVRVYKVKKETWESNRINTCIEASKDTKSLSTKSTESCSRATTLSVRETIGDMTISFVAGDELTSGETKVRSKAESAEKKPKGRLAKIFWNKK